MAFRFNNKTEGTILDMCIITNKKETTKHDLERQTHGCRNVDGSKGNFVFEVSLLLSGTLLFTTLILVIMFSELP